MLIRSLPNSYNRIWTVPGRYSRIVRKGLEIGVRSKFERTYRDYLERILNQYSKGKSFFIRSEPMPIYAFFVPLDLATQLRILPKASASDVARVAPHSIITGSGGSGKTMMMRHLLLSTVMERAKTPIFFELRQLNQQTGSLRELLLQTVQLNGLEIDEEYFELALAAGHFSLILDGFDELQRSRRKAIAKEIQELAQVYGKNWIVMSSRPDDELEGWGLFTKLRIQPLDLESAVELVQKLPFDDPIKSKFATDLRSSLFVRHQSFLSNPLLLSIMLLTYSDIAHIPDKLTIFYSQAYESLFQKHDALKGGFQRERRSGLDIQDFGRAFAAFCIQSFDSREFSFSRSRALEILEVGKAITELEYDSQAFLDDASQSVCLLVEDGIELAFAHRSFQEYFAARFIHSCPSEIKRDLIRRISSLRADSVMSLLFELDRYAVERYYILPALGELRKKLAVTRQVGVSHFLRYIKILYTDFGIEDDENGIHSRATISDLDLYDTVSFVAKRYQTSNILLDARKMDAVQQVITEQLGGNYSPGISTRSLTTKSLLVKALYEAPGRWGADHLRTLLDVEHAIKRRHEGVQQSLHAILEKRKIDRREI